MRITLFPENVPKFAKMELPASTIVLCQIAFLVLGTSWQCSGHKIFNPLEAIRYDRARVRLGQSGAAERLPVTLAMPFYASRSR